uniref:Putative ParA protein n=1 Tax=Caedibacter taeniospiralis TaxID=28907 RepID=Q6TFE5_CAETA|nr:putative ParA protein [Caedibacter taeniospiralis]
MALIELDQQANLTRTLGVDARKKPVLIDYINDKLEISDLLINIFDGLDFIPSRVDNALLDNSLMLGKHPLDKVFNKPFSELKSKYDIIVIDCPPSIGSAVSAATLASDEIIMPITPTDYALAGLELTHHEILNLCEKYDKDIVLKILFNKFDSRTNLSHEVMKYVLKNKQCNSILLRSYIRSLQSIENCIAASISVFDSFKKTPEKEDFSLLTSEILGI